MIRLVVSDIDGTLLPDGTDRINPEIFDVIRKLKEKGIFYVAASGRQFASIRRLFAPVAEDIYYITDGGGILRSFDEILFADEMRHEDVKAIVEDVKKLPECEVLVCGAKCAYGTDRESKMYRWLQDSYRFDLQEIPDLTKPVDDKIVKVSVYHESDAEKVCASWFTPKWKEQLQLACAGKEWIDCIPKTSNKGNSLQMFQKRLGIKKSETMVFGDNINDLEMLACAGESYAVENARQEVKRAAKYIARSYHENGVIEVMKGLL